VWCQAARAGNTTTPSSTVTGGCDGGAGGQLRDPKEIGTIPPRAIAAPRRP
jgi:hypothetical protein